MGFYFESSFIKIEVRNLNIIIGGCFELSSFIMPKVGNLDAMIRSYFTYFQNDRGQYFFYLKYIHSLRMARDKGQTGKCNPIKHENFWFSSKSFLEPPSCNGNMKRRTSTWCEKNRQQKILTQNCWTFLGITSSFAWPTSERVRINGLCRSSFVNLSTSELPHSQISVSPNKWNTNASKGPSF